MVPHELIKIKKIAKTRIWAEQVIWQVKILKIFFSELPMRLKIHIDDVLIIQCALGNLKPNIFRD